MTRVLHIPNLDKNIFKLILKLFTPSLTISLSQAVLKICPGYTAIVQTGTIHLLSLY